MSDRTIYRFEDIEWHVPEAEGTDAEEAARAGEQGAGRKFLAQGDGGFYAQIVQIPSNFEAPAHAHNHAEIFMVLEGSCTFGGQQMSKYDMTVVPEGGAYGFTAGPDGVRFLVIRNGVASFAKVAS